MNEKLNHVKENPNDEYYTTAEEAARVLGPYLLQLQTMKIVCPADSKKESEIYKYLKRNGCKVKAYGLPKHDMFGPKSLGAVCRADIVITNPPFSHLRAYMAALNHLQKDFILLVPELFLGTGAMIPHVHCINLAVPHHKIVFHNGRALNNAVWITTLPRPHEHIYEMIDGILNVDKFADIPHDYDGPIAIPNSAVWRVDTRAYEIIRQVRFDGIFGRTVIKHR